MPDKKQALTEIFERPGEHVELPSHRFPSVGQQSIPLYPAVKTAFREVDTQGIITYSSPEHDRLFGYEPGQMLGQPYWITAASPQQARLMREILEVLVRYRVEPGELETTARTRQGRPIHVLSSWCKLHDEAGRLIGFRNYLTDVTARRGPTPPPSLPTRPSQPLLDSLPFAALLVNRNRRVVGFNAQAWREGAREGAFCWEFFFGPGHLDGPVTVVDENGREEAHLEGRACDWCRADVALGQKVFCQHKELKFSCRYFNLFWIPTDDGVFLHYALDITAQTRAGQELAELKKIKSRFFSRLSHEIKTPLNGITGMLDLALTAQTAEEQREYLMSVKASSEELERLMTSLLKAGEAEAGALTCKREEFSLRRALEETFGRAAARAWAKGLEVALRVWPDVPDTLVGDEEKLMNVVARLTDNAIKFTEEGEIFLRVKLSGRADGQVTLHFAVADSGAGIHPDRQPEIFEAFTPARRSDGAGVGLAVCRRLVELMDGEIWVDSQEDQGATFHFTARFGQAPDRRDERPEAAKTAGLAGASLFIACPLDSDVQVLSNILESEGARIRRAGQGLGLEQALFRARTGLDLVILDAGLKDPDPFELTPRLQGEGLPVLLLLPGPEAETSQRLAQARPQGHLYRPVHRHELITTIQAVLRHHEKTSPPLDPPQARVKPGPLDILLAEDNAINRKLARIILERKRHRIIEAVNGQEALDILAARKVDLVLMDVTMPVMDGLEATRRIRRTEAGARGTLPIIALTAHTLAADRAACLEAGMDGVVNKPLDSDRLYRLIDDLAAGRFTAAEEEPPHLRGRVLDQAALLERLGDNRELLTELVEIFNQSLPRHFWQMSEAVSAADQKALKSAAHAFKGVAAHLSAPASVEAAVNLERAALAADFAAAARALEELRYETVLLGEALKALVAG